MSTTLASLVTILESEVPAVNSVPTDAQYEQAIKDAAREFSRRCGLAKIAELSIVSGTATYSLASDFISLIFLEAITGVDGVIVSPSGLVPVDADWDEEYTIVNGQITFYPTPTYSMDREYKYKAAWELTGTGASRVYATMGEDEAQVVMIKAKGIAIEKQALALAAAGGMKYSLGAVSVDKSGGMGDLSAKVYKLHGEFVTECERYNGAVLL